MKKLFLIIATFALSVAAFGASIDGKWTMEQKAKDQTVVLTFNLKSDGGTVTGDMTRSAKKPRSASIQNGKIDGDKFSFVTVSNNKKKGEVRTKWEGTVGDNQLTGHRMAEGGKGKKGMAFTMKRAS
jgi:hypothetical protein